VAGGAYKNVEQAQRRMTGTKPVVYRPRKQAAAIYGRLYQLYRRLHDAFGLPDYRDSLYDVMKQLIALRKEIRGET